MNRQLVLITFTMRIGLAPLTCWPSPTFEDIPIRRRQTFLSHSTYHRVICKFIRSKYRFIEIDGCKSKPAFSSQGNPDVSNHVTVLISINTTFSGAGSELVAATAVKSQRIHYLVSSYLLYAIGDMPVFSTGLWTEFFRHRYD
jgi:hypothetical protein